VVPDCHFSDIVEVDETYQRETRKGSREWEMQRSLSQWQLPILTVVDHGGAKMAQRIPDRANATIQNALDPVAPAEAVLCSDALRAYGYFATGLSR
jgi:hypothetical protein